MQSEEIKGEQKKSCLDKYGCENVFQSEKVKNKIKETNLRKYGVENPSSSDLIKKKKIKTCQDNFGVMYSMQSKEVLEKSKKTCLDKYGVENVSQSEEIKKNKSETVLKNYGEDNPFKSDIIKEKIKETNLRIYGFENPSSSEEIKEKKYITTFSHYGVKVPYLSEEIKEKGIKTLKENNNFTTSKPEEQLYLMLCDKFGKDDVERQYKDKRYPFYCDFFIISIDTFIEVNAFWAHGFHWFDSNNKDDIEKLESWKAKALPDNFYSKAIEVWTVSDLNKRDTAKENNINYVVFWDSNLTDAKEWLDKV